MQMLHARMARHGAAWFAEEQTVGKGQRGKSWFGNKGENIALSIVTEPHFLSPVNSFWLTAAVATGVCDFVKTLTGDEITIKWPNDIYWRDRKAGGILIESIIRAEKWLFAVIGTGLNINQEVFPSALPNAVSVRQIAGRAFDVVELAKELCTFLERKYVELEKGGQEEILRQYNLQLYKLNEPVRFKSNEQYFIATVKGVTSEGLLMIEKESIEQTLAWGAAEWVVE